MYSHKPALRIESIVEGFIATGIWCEEESLEMEAEELETETGEFFDVSVHSVSEESRWKVEYIVRKFIEKAGEDTIVEFKESANYSLDSTILNDDMAVGSDLFLNMNGHGVGFWSRDGKHKDTLSKIAGEMGSLCLYMDNNGLIEFY